MRRVERVHRGRQSAAAVLIEVGIVGPPEARRRVLELFRPGTTVRQVAGERWLVVLEEPIELDAGQAPGAVLTESDGGLVGGPELRAEAGEVVAWHAGRPERFRPSDGEAVDLSEWLEIGDLPVLRLEPVTLPIGIVVDEAQPLPPADVRQLAHVRERSAESRAIEEAFGTVVAHGRARGGGGGGSGGSGGSGGGTRTGLPNPFAFLGSLLADLLMRTPLANTIERRERAYLERLTRDFDRDVDEALRNAIPLGGLGGGARSLRMPSRRTSLEISRGRIVRRTSVAFGPTAYGHLLGLYRAAADRLEQAGRIDEAAFALIELLANAPEGVALLERNGRFELAARIAEDRQLDPALTIRLWWQAGERRRAVAVARRHRRFGAVVERLEAIDPIQARDLRLEWVNALELAGDLLGAIEAGWPDRHLRPLLANVALRGADVGGPVGAALLAYRLALRPGEAVLEEARAFLTEIELVDRPSLVAFATAWETTDGGGPTDREIASMVLRALTRIGPTAADRPFLRLQRAVRQRADPVLVADTPHGARSRTPGGVIEAPVQAGGSVPILDAVALPSGRVLVALGEAGCRLVAADGRTVARWEIATHTIVAADHGGAALLIAHRDAALEVVRLDLATRRTRHYGIVRGRPWADTFDGSLWHLVDDRGVATHDVLADHPTVIWRELESRWTCIALARDAEQLSALVLIPGDHGRPDRTERWRWRLETQTLALRQPTTLGDSWAGLRLLSDAGLLDAPEGGRPVIRNAGSATPFTGASEGDRILTSQSLIGVVAAGKADMALLRIQEQIGNPVLRATIPLDDDGLGFRALGSRVTAWDGTGRLVAVDLATSQLLMSTRLHE